MKWDTEMILSDIKTREEQFTAFDVSLNVSLKPSQIGKIINSRLSNYVEVVGVDRVGFNFKARKIYRRKIHW